MSPFEGMNNTDLNRCFPGNEKGGFTERTGHAVYRALRRYATHFIDFAHRLYEPTPAGPSMPTPAER